jgi:hypothetical protein
MLCHCDSIIPLVYTHFLKDTKNSLLVQCPNNKTFCCIYVKIDKNALDLYVKIGYYIDMFINSMYFILRISLVVALWAFIWKLLVPRTQLMRILRAAALVLGLLGILLLLRSTGL